MLKQLHHYLKHETTMPNRIAL